MKCYLCNSNKISTKKGKVRDNPELKIYYCNDCDLVFLDIEKIDLQFYVNGGMDEVNQSVEEFFETMEYMDTIRRFKKHYLRLANKKILDFGCGKSSFLLKLKMEKISKDLYAYEPNRTHHDFLEKNFVLLKDFDEIPDNYFDFITMFHVLEHLDDPIKYLNDLGKKLNPKGKIIVETPNADDALLTLYESESFANFTYWSCHLFLFNNSTIFKLINKTKLKIDYIQQIQRYPLSNHLYWLSKGKPGGHVFWNFLDNEGMNKIYENQLANLGICDTIETLLSLK